MTVQDLVQTLSLTPYHLGDPTRSLSSGYCGDLLSWVMGKAQPDCVWLTIMSHVNVAAVATLADVGCIVLTEGVEPDPALLEKAKAQQLNLLGTSRSTFACATALAPLLE